MNEIETLERLAFAAAELVDEIGDQAERDRASYEAGQRAAVASLVPAMFQHAEDIGYVRAHREIDREWAALAEKVRAMAGQPTHAHLEEQRRQPSGAAYYAQLIRHGGTEFAGLDRPRVPAPPGAYERALEWARQQQRREDRAA